MKNESSLPWLPIDRIDTPCADLAFRYTPPDCLEVRMRFSNVIDGPKHDLLLIFVGAIAAQWESETFGLIQMPEPLPKCSSSKWSSWTFPLLHIENSRWWALHEARDPILAERRNHFVLVTMNDLLHVLAKPTVSATWVSPEQ